MKYDSSKQIVEGFKKIKEQYPFNYPVQENDPFYKLVSECLDSCDLFSYKKHCKEINAMIPEFDISKKDFNKIYITYGLQLYLDDWCWGDDTWEDLCNDDDPNTITIKKIIEDSATDFFEMNGSALEEYEEAFADEEVDYDQFVLAIWSVLPEIYHKVTGGHIVTFG